MRYMICYATRLKTPQIETEYFDKFADAVMKYTVLCSNCYDVVLSDVESEKILRQFSYRYGSANVCVSNH